jgi:putative redox protein
MRVTTTYAGQMRFEQGDGDSRVVMDARPEVGGRGEALSPKQMVLQGLAGCTGMDVVSMLRKKGVEYDSFSIEVEAEQTSHHPVVFREIHLTFRFVADEADRPTIERMIHLSESGFCGVTAMLGKTAEITWDLVIEPR